MGRSIVSVLLKNTFVVVAKLQKEFPKMSKASVEAVVLVVRTMFVGNRLPVYLCSQAENDENLARNLLKEPMSGLFYEIIMATPTLICDYFVTMQIAAVAACHCCKLRLFMIFNTYKLATILSCRRTKGELPPSYISRESFFITKLHHFVSMLFNSFKLRCFRPQFLPFV